LRTGIPAENAMPVPSVRNSNASEELRSNRLEVKFVYLKLHGIASLLGVPPNRFPCVERSDGGPIKERSFEGSNNRDLRSIHGAPA